MALTFLYFLMYPISGSGFFKPPGKTDDKINTRSTAKCIVTKKRFHWDMESFWVMHLNSLLCRENVEQSSTLNFCYSRSKKKGTVYQLILMETRMNGVSSQAFFNISVTLRKRFFLLESKKNTLTTGQDPRRLLHNLNRRETTFCCRVVNTI